MNVRWQWVACWVGVSVVSFVDAGCGSGDTSGARSGVGGAAAAGAPSGGDSGGAESGAAAGTEEGGGGEADVGGAAGGAAGSEACVVGEERCDCYPNQTCNGTLRCLSGLCVADVEATGGAAGAGGGATGGEPPEGGAAGSTASQGGTEPSGGATSGGSAAGGAAGAPGGAATGGASGGTTSDGGSATGGAAGAPGGTASGGAGGTPGGTGGADTGGADTGGTGGEATGGADTGGTGGATSCFSAPDEYIDFGGILGYAWGYRVIDGIGESASLRANTLALDFTLPGATYEELAAIGFNLNQPTVPGDDPAYGHDVADEVGICIFGTGFDRITVEDDSGGSWCVEHSGCATWDEFTETCWEPGPALPANAVIYKAAAIAPIRTLEEQSSTICITNLYLWDGT